MALLTPVDREFAVLPSGHIRDKVILANFRSGLRLLNNPRTGQPFTEDEIFAATRPGSRWYREAQAIDDYGQLRQRNAIWLADQLQLDRASSQWVVNYHAKPRGMDLLPATGGGGAVEVTGSPGTIVQGSTVMGAAGAYVARDPTGSEFQVFFTGTLDSEGKAVITIAGLTTGKATNLKEGTVLTWKTRDPSMAPTCKVVFADFTGGTDRETIAELQLRIAANIRYKPAVGNDPQFREWGRKASNAIDDAFIYPCALNTGTGLVAITAKRAGAVGPLGMVPGATTLAAAVGYLVPPLSPVVNPRTFVLVTPTNSEPADAVVNIALQRGTDAGWADSYPFPAYSEVATPAVTVISSPTVFRFASPANTTLPNRPSGATASGANAPSLMVWNAATSQFVELDVDQVEDLTGGVFEVTLNTIPTDISIEVGVYVSPLMSRHAIVASAAESYFDGLGPGEIFNEETDTRAGRCVRFPDTGDERPSSTGAILATRIIEALGGSSSDAALMKMSVTRPSYQSNLLLGPNKITLGRLAVYRST